MTSEENSFCEYIRNQIDVQQDIVLEPLRTYIEPFYVYSKKDELKNFHTFNGYKPKTMLFYSNYCELELLRIAYLFHALDEEKKWIYDSTKQRIQSNCFGRFCWVVLIGLLGWEVCWACVVLIMLVEFVGIFD